MPKEITMEKMIDASVERVWSAWTDPEELKRWWGPNDVTIPECEIDLRVGGKFYIVMEAGAGMGPFKGTKWPMDAEFTDIVPQKKIAYKAQAWTEGDKEATTIDQTTEITLSDVGGKTKVSVKAAIHKAGPKAQMAVEGMQYGFTQQLAKLNTYLK